MEEKIFKEIVNDETMHCAAHNYKQYYRSSSKIGGAYLFKKKIAISWYSMENEQHILYQSKFTFSLCINLVATIK